MLICATGVAEMYIIQLRHASRYGCPSGAAAILQGLINNATKFQVMSCEPHLLEIPHVGGACKRWTALQSIGAGGLKYMVAQWPCPLHFNRLQQSFYQYNAPLECWLPGVSFPAICYKHPSQPNWSSRAPIGLREGEGGLMA